MKVKVDVKKCLGCGMCINLCPAVFEFKEGKSSVKKNVSIEKNKQCINQVISLCPAQAIKIEK